MQSPSPSRRKIVVVGGGVAGACVAWLLDGACDVVLLEASPRLGGHAHTVEVEHRGLPLKVDLGAQFYSPGLHPRFVCLLQLLGVYDPGAPDSGDTVTREMDITLWHHGASTPRFVSPRFWRRVWPVLAPWNIGGQLAFLAFTRAARRLEAEGDWDALFDPWLRTIPGLGEDGREAIILPWLAAMSGCSIDDIRGFSARAAAGPAARGLPPGLFDAYRWSTARIGLGGVVDRLVAGCTGLRTYTSAPATGLELRPEGVRIHVADRPPEDADDVVFAAPPHALVPLFAGDPALSGALAAFRWFRSRLVIHDQPTYMPVDRRHWSAYNVAVHQGWCEASVWYGAIRDPHPDGGTVDVFKSWATGRPEPPGGVLHEAEYRHCVHTPATRRAQEAVAARQGDDHLWFAGSWTHDLDLQETALRSAFDVARRLAPDAPNLLRLAARFAASEA